MRRLASIVAGSLRSPLLLSSSICFAAGTVMFVMWWPTLNDPVVATISLGPSSLDVEYCTQDVTIHFRNDSNRDIRVIGFTPFCCSGQFGFAVKSVGVVPPLLAPGEEFSIECEASFSQNTLNADDRLERVAGQLLMDIDRVLVSQDVNVGFCRSKSLAACRLASDPD